MPETTLANFQCSKEKWNKFAYYCKIKQHSDASKVLRKFIDNYLAGVENAEK